MFTKRSAGKRRSFSIVVGLKEGYGEEAREHGIRQVEALALDWMKDRAAAAHRRHGLKAPRAYTASLSSMRAT